MKCNNCGSSQITIKGNYGKCDYCRSLVPIEIAKPDFKLMLENALEARLSGDFEVALNLYLQFLYSSTNLTNEEKYLLYFSIFLSKNKISFVYNDKSEALPYLNKIIFNDVSEDYHLKLSLEDDNPYKHSNKVIVNDIIQLQKSLVSKELNDEILYIGKNAPKGVLDITIPTTVENEILKLNGYLNSYCLVIDVLDYSYLSTEQIKDIKRYYQIVSRPSVYITNKIDIPSYIVNSNYVESLSSLIESAHLVDDVKDDVITESNVKYVPKEDVKTVKSFEDSINDSLSIFKENLTYFSVCSDKDFHVYRSKALLSLINIEELVKSNIEGVSISIIENLYEYLSYCNNTKFVNTEETSEAIQLLTDYVYTIIRKRVFNVETSYLLNNLTYNLNNDLSTINSENFVTKIKNIKYYDTLLEELFATLTQLNLSNIVFKKDITDDLLEKAAIRLYKQYRNVDLEELKSINVNIVINNNDDYVLFSDEYILLALKDTIEIFAYVNMYEKPELVRVSKDITRLIINDSKDTKQFSLNINFDLIGETLSKILYILYKRIELSKTIKGMG